MNNVTASSTPNFAGLSTLKDLYGIVATNLETMTEAAWVVGTPLWLGPRKLGPMSLTWTLREGQTKTKKKNIPNLKTTSRNEPSYR